jgi:hypothetical protein
LLRVLLAICTLLLQLPPAPPCHAADISVKAELSSSRFPEDEAVLLTVTVQGARSAEPELPAADGLRFIYRGQSSQMQWINGKSSSSIVFTFLVQAEKTGKHTIQPIKVTVDGSSYTTNPLSCTVARARAGGGASGGSQGMQSPQHSNAPTARLRSGEAEKIGFMRISPKKNTIYSGELVPFTIKAYFRQGVRITLRSAPRFIGENFILHSLDDKPEKDTELVNGTPYTTLTWTGALSAVKQGTFPLEVEMDAGLQVRVRQQRSGNPFGSSFFNDPFFNDFFARYTEREVKMASPEKSITVMDLPKKGRPENFHGPIGTFSLAVAASPLDGKVGDPVTLKMVLSGTGNFDMVQVPELTNSDHWKIYPATESFTKQGVNRGKKTFEQAIVPTSPDLNAIGPVRFSYFDPDAKEYITLTSDPIAIRLQPVPGKISRPRVHPATKQQQSVVPKTTAGPGNLAPIHPDPGRLFTTIAPLYQKTWFILLMLLAVACLAASLLLRLRSRTLEKNPGILRHKQVNRKLEHHFSEMKQAVANGDHDTFARHCRTAIQERLGEIWGKQARAITLADLEERLDADAPLLGIFKTLELCEYSEKCLGPDAMKQILETTQTELNRLS